MRQKERLAINCCFALCGECSVLAQGGRNVKEYEIEIEGGGLSHTN